MHQFFVTMQANPFDVKHPEPTVLAGICEELWIKRPGHLPNMPVQGPRTVARLKLQDTHNADVRHEMGSQPSHQRFAALTHAVQQSTPCTA
jgi:hypothetical protein